jgi:hypothetical protein
MNFGGVNNTPIPNYVFRWTEHEVEKTNRAYDPLGRPLFHYDYALRLPIARWRALKNKFTAALAMVALPLSKVFTWLFPRQCNNLAFVVEKVRLPEDMHPWLTLKEGKPALDAQWVNQHYGEVK